MKHTRYPAGSFLEIDDLRGGRKVVMVAKDGVTFLESTLAEAALTPVTIHPVLHPVQLGTLSQFAMARGLTVALRRVVELLRERFDPRFDRDPLYLMRVLWCVAQRAAGAADYVPDAQAVDQACWGAAEQEQAAAKLHLYAARYAEATAAAG